MIKILTRMILSSCILIIIVNSVNANESTKPQQSEFSFNKKNLTALGINPPEGDACTSDKCVGLFNKLKKYARNGHPKAQLLMGAAYLSGDIIEYSPKKAAKNLKKALNAGSPRAAWMLSHLYASGIGTEIDKERSVELLNFAIKKGFIPAMYQQAINLLDVHSDQDDNQSNKRSINLLEQAAEKNFKPAIFLLAKMYEQGVVLEKSPIKAVQSYQKLSASNFKDSKAMIQRILQKNADNSDLHNALLTNIHEIEVIEVYGKKWDLEAKLDFELLKMKRSGLYDGKSAFSHIKGKTCNNSAANCLSISAEEDVAGFMMDAALAFRKAGL